MTDRQTDRQNIRHMMQLSSSACCCHPYAPYLRVRDPVLHPHTEEQVRPFMNYCYLVYQYKDIVKLNAYPEEDVKAKNVRS